MISQAKKNSKGLGILTSIFLSIAIISTLTGCTSSNKKATSETNKVVQAGNNTKNIEMLTGNVAVEGKGVVITLSDNESNKNDISSTVRDGQIKEIVCLLKSAGAEIISVNDERLLPISQIKADKMAIKVNNKTFNNPFVIKAIGDPEVLNNELTLAGSYPMKLKECLGVKIEKQDKIVIPKYSGDIKFNYAKPVVK